MEFSELYGKKIYKSSKNDKDELILGIDGVGKVRLWDDGQSCCEHRYITCDDDVSSLEDSILTRIECRDGGGEDTGNGYDCHETMFVEVRTDKGFITLTTHNVHNGYYGGFLLCVEKLS